MILGCSPFFAVRAELKHIGFSNGRECSPETIRVVLDGIQKVRMLTL